MQIEIGKKIHDLRATKGYTQDQLAALCNVSHAAVSKWENGTNYPDIQTLPILARIFQISVDELLNFERVLTKEQIVELRNTCLQTFQSASFDEAMDYVKTLLYTYPNSENLKLQIASLWMYVCLMIQDEKDKEQFRQLTLTLLEDIQHSDDIQIRQAACITLSSLYSQQNEFEKAETTLQEIPQMMNTYGMLASLYVQQGKYEEACTSYQDQLYVHVNEINMILTGLLTIAIKQENTELKTTYQQLQKDVIALFQLDRLAISLATTQDYTQDKETALNNLKTLIDQLQNLDDFAGYMKEKLHQIPWFQFVSVKNQQTPFTLTPKQILAFLDEPVYDYLREEPEFKTIVENIQHKCS